MSQPATQIAPHIETVPGRCGGKPCIAGTRIRVWDVHVWHDLRGLSPAEIVIQFPQLSLADVHAALTYYLDHREEIEAEMMAAEEAADQLAASQGSTKYTRLRDALLQKEPEDDGDPVSSG